MGGLASLAALAASGASWAEQDEAWKPLVDIPEATMRDLLALARAAGLKPELEPKFRLACRVLWRHFEIGAYPASVPERHRHAVWIAAYNKEGKKKRKFGDLVVERLEKWSPTGEDPLTNRCAVRCGENARDLASDQHTLEIGEEIYRNAWDQTEVVMTRMLTHAREIAKLQGRTISEDAKGNGC
jgi:hypothetical protein